MRKKQKNDAQSFDKLKTLIISIVMSIIAWIAIVNIVNPDVSTTFRNIPIRLTGVASLREKELVVVSSSEFPDCNIKIKGKRKDVINASTSVYAAINVSEISRQGTATVPVTVFVPSSVKLVKQELSSVEVSVEPSYRKNIPVTITQQNVPKQNIIDSVPEKDVIEITGAKSELDLISECNISIDFENTTSDSSLMYPFSYLSADGELITTADTVYCQVTNILVSNTIYDKKTVKPKLVLPEKDELKFRLEYDKSKISDQSISIGVKSDVKIPDELIYTIKPEDIKQGAHTLYPECEAIEGIYIPKKQLAVSLTAKEIVTKSVSVSISHEKLSEGLKVKDFPESKKFTLSGTEDELTNVKATVDLSGLGAGTHHLTLKFSDSDIKSDTPATIAVTLE